MELLRDILEAMRQDKTEHGFESHKVLRRENRRKAAAAIAKLASSRPLSPNRFLAQYEHLLEFFHSGGLARGKTTIAQHSAAFQAALAEIVAADRRDVGAAYSLLLEHFQEIPRADVNVITEILHALSNKRFAVMNRNAVSGMRLANIYEFPTRPLKSSVTPDRYTRFCEAADQVRQELGLANFTELDALFNYAYWDREDDDE